MKQDTIFYQLFKRSPTLLFKLLAIFPPNADAYRFESIEVKETSFRADGVFLPPNPDEIVFFCEVQQERDDFFYERVLAEIGIFVYRGQRKSFADWRAVIIYRSRSVEQERLEIVQEFLASGRISRIYLDELGEIEELPWSMGLMALTILPGDQMLTEAKAMLQRIEQPETSPEGSAILDLVITAVVYKFSELTRDEVLSMLGIELKEPRAFREVREEGKVEGKVEGKAEGKAEGKTEGKAESIEAILLVRFGVIDEKLATVIPKLLALDSHAYTQILLNSSLAEILALP
jgi:predicted transposase/invertase (TIGR01784 family)